MDDNMASDLQRLAEKYEINEATVLRRALALYVEVKKDEDNKVIIKNTKMDQAATLMNI